MLLLLLILLNQILVTIPKNYNLPEEFDYFHCTSNNTIYGTQMKEFPSINGVMVCDMSSDIFSRKINIRKI